MPSVGGSGRPMGCGASSAILLIVAITLVLRESLFLSTVIEFGARTANASEKSVVIDGWQRRHFLPDSNLTKIWRQNEA